MKSAKIVCFVLLVFIKPQIHKAYLLSNLSYFVWVVPKGNRDEAGQGGHSWLVIYAISLQENFNILKKLKDAWIILLRKKSTTKASLRKNYLTLHFHERKKSASEIKRTPWTTGATISVILKNSLQLNCSCSRKSHFV